MRRANVLRWFPLLLLVPPTGADAQEIPDTTAAERYFPLGPGDEWHYWKETDWTEPSVWAERRTVVGDTVVAGTALALYRYERFDPATWTLLEPPRTYALRVHPETGAIEVVGEGPSVLLWPLQTITCPLNAPFFAFLECPELPVVTTSGGLADVSIGGTAVRTTVKYFDTQGSGEYVATFFAGVGYAGYITFGGGMQLRYASVGGVEFGSPIVAAEPSSVIDRLSVDVAPNPTFGAGSVRLTLPTARDVRVVIYDVLGRERGVLHEGPMSAGGHALHVELPAGVYIVRASAGTDAAVTRWVVAR
jgi:hypothetical protein